MIRCAPGRSSARVLPVCMVRVFKWMSWAKTPPAISSAQAALLRYMSFHRHRAGSTLYLSGYAGGAPMIPIALPMAGSDPSGGAGTLADLTTFRQHRVYGEAVRPSPTREHTP